MLTKKLVPILLLLPLSNLILLCQAETDQGLRLFADYKTEILSPASGSFYTDLMPLNFTVEWRKNVTTTWLIWMAPSYSYSIDNGSRQHILRSGIDPYINFKNSTTEMVAVNDIVDVSGLKDGAHELTLYAEVTVAWGQVSPYNCTLGSVNFQVGNPSPPWTKIVETNALSIIVGLTIALAVASVAIYLKRKHRKSHKEIERAFRPFV
ncbi:MAG: hypothetical protein NWE96_04630 [Candidatus Bathyarchaeota archaeon]|nr:hypothetical protein [Candidatus Bathyarchaeota archaeon]